MKKFFLFILVATATLSGCQDIEDAIANLDDRVTKLENTTIPSINEQIQSINTSISDLETIDAELKNYITALQGTAAELQKSINTTNTRIDEVKSALQGEISLAKSDVLAQLEALKSETNNELALVNATLDSLKVKDAELESMIKKLKEYANTELQNTKDWASATFTTLEQYHALCSEVATIKTQIETLNASVLALETRLNDKMAADIATAVKGLQEELADSVIEITSAYTAAIATAKDEITEAYTAEIQSAISTLEASMKQWVGEQLSNYYTIAEVDALIEALNAEFDGKLTTQKIYLESLVSSLSQTLTTKISANGDLIAALRNDITSLEGEVAQNAKDIADNAEKISTNATSIIENAKAIAANGDKYEENKTAIEENATLIAENKQLIADIDTKIDNTSNAANTKAIAENANAIADNAAILAENSLAINNHASAIAANTLEIENLKASLNTTKDEITEAYTELINTSINNLDGKLDNSVATINSRIDNEVATINSRLDALAARVEALENDVESIKNTIATMQSEIAAMQQQISDLLARIQSVTYIPKYSDGRATMDYGTKEAELDFMISPKSTVTKLATLWSSALSVKAVYTQTRAVNFIDLPVTSFDADAKNGVISLTVSGANLNDDFYVEQQDASFVLQISDGNSNISSEYVAMTPNYNIEFEDSYVKLLCCKNWDTNGDGELSYAEAAAVTNIGSTFYDEDILVFTEFQYFTGVTEIPNWGAYNGAFEGCEALKKIILPESLVTISDYAFENCTHLSIINLPKGLTSIGRYVFKGCSSLTGDIVIPKGIITISEGMFQGCKSLSSVTLPPSIVEIKAAAFANCPTVIYCKSTTPPSVYAANSSTNVFTEGSIIYVPGNSYEQYMQYSEYDYDDFTSIPENWVKYEHLIQPYDFE